MRRTATDELKLPVLMSYAFLRDKPSACADALSRRDVELLVDCGAFTAKNAGYEIRLDDYMAFLFEGGAHTKMFGYLALDKLQDPKTTDENLQVMLRQGLKPIPVHVFGDDGARMEQLFEWSDWVALGGMRRPHRGAAPPAYVKQRMEWARGRNVHWLGYVRLPAIRAFRPFSADCSSFSSGMRYGNVQAYAGRGRWLSFDWRTVCAEGPHLRHEVRQLLAYYDIPVEYFLDRRYWGRGGLRSEETIVSLLPTRSWVRYVAEVRRSFGTRVFLATLPAMLPRLLDAFDWFKGKESEDQGLRHDDVRRVPPVAGRARRGGVPAPAS